MILGGHDADQRLIHEISSFSAGLNPRVRFLQFQNAPERQNMHRTRWYGCIEVKSPGSPMEMVIVILSPPESAWTCVQGGCIQALSNAHRTVSESSDEGCHWFVLQHRIQLINCGHQKLRLELGAFGTASSEARFGAFIVTPIPTSRATSHS